MRDLPFSFWEDWRLRRILRILNPKVAFISRRHIRSTILDEFAVHHAELQVQLKVRPHSSFAFLVRGYDQIFVAGLEVQGVGDL